MELTEWLAFVLTTNLKKIYKKLTRFSGSSCLCSPGLHNAIRYYRLYYSCITVILQLYYRCITVILQLYCSYITVVLELFYSCITAILTGR